MTRMATVVITAEAQAQMTALPVKIHARVHAIIARLAAWPAVTGAKRLRGRLAGYHRIRTGDYRVQFRVAGNTVIVVKVGHRDGFYED